MRYRLGDLTVKEWNSWDRVPRMPQVFIAAAGAVGVSTATLFTVAGTAVSASTIVGYLAYTAVTSWALNALTPKPDFGAGTSAGVLVNSRSAAAPQDFVYGEVRKGGVVTYYESSGTSNKYLHQIIVLAGHEVNSIGDIYINDDIVTINASGYVTSQSWNSKIFIRKFTGGSSQNVKSTLDNIANFNGPSLPANFRGDGIACLYVRYEYNQDAFPNGVPTITAKVQGKKVYDPRNSTTAYSNNAALCIRDFITSSYGLADDSIDDTSFSAAANECDEDVSLSGGGTENRYTINGIVKSDRSVGDALQDLTTACAGTLFWGCGAWKLKVGVYTDPVNANDPLTLDDLRGPITLDTKVTMRDNFNTVSGTFVDEDQGYITVDYPQIVGTSFVAEDAGESVVLDLSLPYTTSSPMAQRLAKLTLFRGREQMTLNADFGMKAFEYEVGDIIEFSNERFFGEVNPVKEFEVIGWRLAGDQEGGDLRINLTLRETSEDAFDWNAEESAIIANNTTLDDGFDTQTPTLNSPVVTTDVMEDGTTVPSITFGWSVDNPELVSYYEFQFKTTGASDYNSRIVYDGEYTLSPAISNTSYNYRVRTFNALGRKSAFVSAVSPVSTGNDATTPNAPTSPSAAAGYQAITLTWTAPTTNTDSSTLKDLFQYKIYRGTSTNPTTLVGRVSGEIFTDSGLADGTEYYYRIKAVDFTGNESDFSDNASATTNDALIVPEYAEIQVADPYVISANAGTDIYLSNMAGGAGDFWFIRNAQTGTLTATFSNNQTVSFNKNIISQGTLVGGGTYIVDIVAIERPTEGSNTDQELAALDTLKVGSLLYYEADEAYQDYANEGITWRITEVFDKQVYSASKSYYFFRVTRVSGQSTVIANANTETAHFITNYQLKGADGTSGDRGAGRWNIGVSSVTAGSFSTGTTYWITTVGTTDFTAIGATANTVGLSFTATGAGSGTGTATPLPTTSSGANTDFVAAIGTPVDLDQAWFYAGTQASPVAQKVWIYDAGTSTWSEQTEVIDGNLLVTGSINASKIAISDESASSRIEIAENKILIYDAGTLRVKLGDLS